MPRPPLGIVRWSFLAALTAGLSVPALAQTPPPAQTPISARIQRLRQLAAMPGGTDSLKALLINSGLTADQVRNKLRAAGYPESLLDAYLPGGTGTTVTPAPGAAQLAAFDALGIAVNNASAILPVDTGFIATPGSTQVHSRVFGVDALRRTTTQFLPSLTGPVPSDYRLGPGDELVLILTGAVELSYQIQVNREGFLLIPSVGQVYVANLTLEQLRDVLYTRLGKAYSGVRRHNATTRFSVSVANVRTIQVYVTGEVTQPSAYQISALGTVLTALYAAGGVAEDADMRQIEVHRMGKTVATMDLYDYLLRGDTRQDIRLETGDVVFVPVHGPRVDIEGAVVRPGIYELTGAEKLPFLLGAAGGVRPDAALRTLTIFRLLSAGDRGPGAAPRAAISVALTPRTAHDSLDAALGANVVVPPVELHSGDSVVVDSLPPLEGTYYVSIAGMVRKEGNYPWRPQMTLRDLLTLAGGPTVGADLREAELARMPKDRSNGQLATTIRVPLDSSYLAGRDSLGRYAGPPGPSFPVAGSAPPVVLQPFDQVLILKQPQFAPQRTAKVTGEVKYPGAYALTSKSERLSDLVQRSGGLLPSAYVDGARFIRALDAAGRVNVDLAAALAHPGGDNDVVLQPGDSLDVPEFEPTVRVQGAVNSPTSVLYKRNADVNYYVDNAGGLTRNADGAKISVRFADGSARTGHKFLFFSRSWPKPGPGSVVTVPSKPERQPQNAAQFLAAMAQVLASTVAILAIATRL